MNGNERFILHNTRTSHKRLESMVIYALHYTLRDVELLSQYHVLTDYGTFKIDAYVPRLNLAVEVDEPYHENQIAEDAKRQEALEKKLGCSFWRINCNESIYSQVDRLVAWIMEEIREKRIDPWVYVPQKNRLKVGEYSVENRQRLNDSGIPDRMDAFANELKSEGVEVSYGSMHGIPSPGNGEYGFLVKQVGFTFAIYARASGRINVRVIDYEFEDPGLVIANDLGLHPRQKKSQFPRGVKYFALPDNVDGYADQHAAKAALYSFFNRVREAGQLL